MQLGFALEGLIGIRGLFASALVQGNCPAASHQPDSRTVRGKVWKKPAKGCWFPPGYARFPPTIIPAISCKLNILECYVKHQINT